MCFEMRELQEELGRGVCSRFLGGWSSDLSAAAGRAGHGEVGRSRDGCTQLVGGPSLAPPLGQQDRPWGVLLLLFFCIRFLKRNVL